MLSGLALGAVRIEYLGHASFLMEDTAGNRVLTDPFLDGYPLAFPKRLSVDVVAVSQRDAAHDAAFQLRGHPAVLGPEHPTATAGAFQVEGIRSADPQFTAYVIRNGGQSIVFLGEAAGRLSPALEQAIRGADVLLTSPAGSSAVQPLLAGRARPPVIGLMSPDRLQPGQPAQARELAAIELTANTAPGVFALKPRPVPADAPDTGVFRDTIVELTWPQVQLAALQEAVALVPVGVIEAHGLHLGLGADTYLAHSQATAIRRELGALGVKAVVIPPLYWGRMADTAEFPGSFHVRPETMAGLLQDIFANLKQWGFRRVVAMNLHGDRQHGRIFAEAVAMAKRDLALEIYDLRRIETPLPLHDQPGRPSAYRPDYHSGAGETRLMMDLRPEDVDQRLAARLEPQPRFQPLAYVGDPASWTTEDGLSAYWRKSARWDAERIAYVMGRYTPPPPAPPAAVAPAVQSILDRYVQGAGGRARLETVQTLVRSGKLTERSVVIPVTIRAASGGKWSLRMAEGRINHLEVFDGQMGWVSEGPDSRQLSVERIAFLAPLLDAQTPLRMREIFSKLAALPDETRDGRVYRRLAAESVEGQALELAFDTQTGLLHRLGEITLDDYREVNGVRWPFLIDLGGGVTARLETIETDVILEPDAFQRPAK
jgi:creatinine amidohydrolase/Fe(II)-dependent formamide hydrolase-like protein